MAKNKTVEATETIAPAKHSAAKIINILLVLALLGGLSAYLWQERASLQKWSRELLSSAAPENSLSDQITALQNQLNNLQANLQSVEYAAHNPDFSAINQRLEDIEHINANTVKSKADVDALMGLLVRLDEAEAKLRALSDVSNEGALLLTAAALVKDAGERGGEFIYESEVLSEIAKGNLKAQKEAEQLAKIAPDGVPSVAELQRDFIAAYVEKFPSDKNEVIAEAQNWKDRIVNQLQKLVRIKKSNDDSEIAKTEPSQEEQSWEIIKDYVVSGEIIRAIGIAEKPLNHDILEDKIFQEWFKHAKTYQQFYNSLNRITANGLAVMKVKFLRN